MLSRDDLLRESAATGFQPEGLEKVVRLFELLETLKSHPFLKTRIALKGGTALNLFVFDVPRLSVDIDLNYVGSADRDVMLADRTKIDEGIQAVCGRLGLQVKRVPAEHAGGKWRLTYGSALGRPATLELDMNYMLRTPLWPVQAVRSRAVGSFVAHDVPMLDVHDYPPASSPRFLPGRPRATCSMSAYWASSHSIAIASGLDLWSTADATELIGARSASIRSESIRRTPSSSFCRS